MNNYEDITWEQLYEYWKYNMWDAPQILKTPITFEEIHVEYKGNGYFYGYDWIASAGLQSRKELIESDVNQFLYFTQPSNKGTIHTLQMLAEAKNDEEIAAIWMYAIAFEMLQNGFSGKAKRVVYQICRVTQRFLSKRFWFWHHAMRKLVPEIYTNYLIREADLESIESIIEIIVLIASLIRHEYVPVLYSSLKQGERCDEYSVRL